MSLFFFLLWSGCKKEAGQTPALLTVSTLAGSTYGYADGTGTAAQFFGPNGVAVNASGNVYVTDTYNNRIRKVQ